MGLSKKSFPNLKSSHAVPTSSIEERTPKSKYLFIIISCFNQKVIFNPKLYILVIGYVLLPLGLHSGSIIPNLSKVKRL